MYFERQCGDNCRLHAINNMFGGPVLKLDEFRRLHRAFAATVPASDRVAYEDNYVNANTWDRSSLISFVLGQKFGMASFTVGMFELQRFKKTGILRSLKDCIDMEFPRIFVCNSGHTWCIRYMNGRWLCLDSLRSNPYVTTLEHWERDPALTLVFPWTRTRCWKGVFEMQGLVRRYFHNATKNEIARRIIDDLSKREPRNFGDCQNWFALFFRYLRLTTTGHEAEIQRFMRYESGCKNDLIHTLSDLPDIVMFILQFKAG